MAIKTIKLETALIEENFDAEGTKYKVTVRATLASKRSDTARTIQLEPAGDYQSLSISGTLYTRHKRGQWKTQEAGQITDTLERVMRNLSPKMQKLVAIWRQWHLNDMRPGTDAQALILTKCASTQYEHCVECLKSNDLYADRGYEYGTEWLVEPLPPKTVTTIRSLARDLGCAFSRDLLK